MICRFDEAITNCKLPNYRLEAKAILRKGAKLQRKGKMSLIDVDLLIELLSDEPEEKVVRQQYEVIVAHDYDCGWMAEFKLPDGEFETIDGHFDYGDSQFGSLYPDPQKTKKWAVEVAMDYIKDHKPCSLVVYPKKGNKVYKCNFT